MLPALTLLFTCQLAGEAITRVAGLTFPGPVLGMGLLLVFLLIRGRSTTGLDGVADTMLKNLSLLFVPAAVGVIQELDLIAANWLAISIAVAASTTLTLLATVLTFRAVSRAQAGRGK